MRTGAEALSLLSVPVNVDVLTALDDGPLSLADLRRVSGSPPQTTLRNHLQRLSSLGVLERRQQPGFCGSIDYELTPAGAELIDVARLLQTWLGRAPNDPFRIGTPAAKRAIKALVDGWSATIIRGMAARPLSLTELSRLISSLNYPSLERRLSAMRHIGMIKACAVKGHGTPYGATDWLRGAVVPLVGAARWERQWIPLRTPPIGRMDVEAAFLLTVPTLELSQHMSGSCRLAVEGGSASTAGVLLQADNGQVTSCVTRLRGTVDASAMGSASSWLKAVVAGQLDHLEISGEVELARGIVQQFHKAFEVEHRPV